MSEFDIIDEATLGELRALNERNLPHRVTVKVARTSGARVGGALVAPGDDTLLEDAACRLVPGSAGSEREDGGQVRAPGSWWLVFAAGTVIPTGAIATVAGEHPDGTAWERVLRVVDGQVPRAFSTSSRFMCVDVSPAGR
jgi:hypothetical protein